MKNFIAVAISATIFGCLLGVLISSVSLTPTLAHAQSLGAGPISASAAACPLSYAATSTQPATWSICGYGAGTTASPYAFCASFAGGACNVPLAVTSAGVTITGTDPIAVSSAGVVSLNFDTALHTGIASLGLTASIPTSSVAVPATSGTLPATTAPVK
jgi:hypothetical protein